MRSAYKKARTPPNEIPLDHRIAASGTFPMEHTNDTTAISGPTTALPISCTPWGAPLRNRAFHVSFGTNAASTPAIKKPPSRSFQSIEKSIAQNFAMDFSMLWKDLLGGFLIAGVLAAFVPNETWKALFLNGAPQGVQLIGNAVVGPLIAVVSFVCSIGNVPLAAILWSSGISFGGVLAFLYADLIVLPLLDIYRKYYGWRMMLYIFGVFFATMVLAAVAMDMAFSALHLVPKPNPNIRHDLAMFSFNYTFWLNVISIGLGLYLWRLNVKHPMASAHHG